MPPARPVRPKGRQSSPHAPSRLVPSHPMTGDPSVGIACERGLFPTHKHFVPHTNGQCLTLAERFTPARDGVTIPGHRRIAGDVFPSRVRTDPAWPPPRPASPCLASAILLTATWATLRHCVPSRVPPFTGVSFCVALGQFCVSPDTERRHAPERHVRGRLPTPWRTKHLCIGKADGLSLFGTSRKPGRDRTCSVLVAFFPDTTSYHLGNPPVTIG